MDKSKPLFVLQGKPVYYGQTLYHPLDPRVGTVVTAEFPAAHVEFPDTQESEFIVVRASNGAVPIVRIDDLSWEPLINHVPDPNKTNMSLCGLLFDSVGDQGPVKQAKRGDTITCPRCSMTIMTCRLYEPGKFKR